jgi:hypothetical protein
MPSVMQVEGDDDDASKSSQMPQVDDKQRRLAGC